MFGNIGWSELFIIASLAILVVGPKELPQFLRVCGKYFGKVKGFADDFRSQFDDVVRDTQIADIKDNILKEVEGVKAALPSEKDIGLDFSELEDADKKPVLEDDEDENLDWDEPDEVIETSADGEVTHHSKKDPSDSADETEPVVEMAQDESQGVAQDSVDADSEEKALRKVVDEDDDDDDGALLDEEEYEGEARTSKDVLEEGRQKFQESVKAEQEEAALARKLERVQQAEKREAAMADSDRRGA